MKKFLFLFPAIFLLVHCGSGAGTESGGSASSVLLNLQISNPDPNATGTAKAVTLSPSEVSQAKTVTRANLTTCTLTVSGSGMTTLTHSFSVSSSASTITTSLSVPPGSSRTFAIDCSDGSATTNNITVGYSGSATADVSENTSSISINPQFKNLIAHTGTVLNYARLNQENSTQTKLTVGFESALTSTEKTNMQVIIELDTAGTRTSLGTIDTNQSNGFVTGTKATPYILIAGASSAPANLYNTSDAKTMKLNCAWGTNSSGNTEIACTFGITQFKTNISSDEQGQYAVAGSLTGASPWDSAPSGGKYAKYNLSPNTNDTDVASLIGNGTTCDSSRNGETCNTGNCATDDGTTYSCEVPSLASFGATCSTASDCFSNLCATSDICLSSTAKTLGNVVTNFVGPPQGTTTTGSTDDTTSGDGSLARFNRPSGICLTPDGTTAFIMDNGDYTLRKVTGIGTSSISVTTFAGSSGSTGTTDGTGTAARFNGPYGCTIDSTGTNMYVTEETNNDIRKVVLASAAVTTLAGGGGTDPGTAGNTNATGTAALFNIPRGIVIDHGGTNLYVTDTNNNSIRKIIITTQVVSTFVGASLNVPQGIDIDSTDTNLYLSDQFNALIRKVVISSAAVTTLAGSGVNATTDGTGTGASFNNPQGVVIDPTGTNLYVSQFSGNKVRKIVIATGVVTSIAGSGAAGDTNGTGSAASFGEMRLIALDPTGATLYIVDQNNNKIRQIQ